MRFATFMLLILSATSMIPVVRADAPDLYDETVVRDLYLYFSQPDWWDQLYANMEDKICIEANLVVDDVTYLQVGVRFKGYSSASVWPAEKMPFKIKMDEYVAGQDLYGYDSVNLSNSYYDPTFTREVLTYHILRKYMPAPRSNYVRLWLNDEYWGIYVNSEQVSGEFLGEWFEDTGGNRYKCQAEDGGGLGESALVWLGSNPASYYEHYQLKSDPTGTEWTDLIGMIDVLNNQPVEDHWTVLAPILNIDRCLWYLVGSNLMCNLDSYNAAGHNYYIYNDPYEGFFNPITWDTNMAFGNFSLGLTVTQLQELSPLFNYGQYNYPLVTKLLDPAAGIRGRKVYLAHFRDMMLAEWNWTNIGGLVQQYQDLIEQDVINDTKKLYAMDDFYDNVTQDVVVGSGPTGGISCGLQPFVENRLAYLQSLPMLTAPYPEIIDTTTSPSLPGPDDDVQVLSFVTVSGATIGSVSAYYRSGAGQLYQKIALFDDGQHNDGAAGDSVYGGVIPALPGGTTVQYFILACTTDETVSLDPIHGEHAPHAYQVQPGSASNGVFINEFLAKNDTGVQDEMGEYEDWVELYNSTASQIDLSGTYLTDDLSDLTKWALPADTFIEAGGTLHIWVDDDENDGPLHATFKLSADGEDIALVDTDGGTLLDAFTFGPQEADISTGRLFDGQTPWVTLLAPSPMALNAPGTAGYRAYSALDSTAHPIALSGVGTPIIDQSTTLQVREGPVSALVVMPISVFAAYQTINPFVDAVLLVGSPFVFILSLYTNISGEINLPIDIPDDPLLVGVPIYSQLLTKANGFIEASNGLEMVIGQ